MNRKERKRRIREKQLEREWDTGGRGETENNSTANPQSEIRNPKSENWETVRCARAMKRAREFDALCKKEGRKPRWPMVLKNSNPKISPQMMKWRRISSITLRLEPFMDVQERRAGLGRLMGWLEKTFAQRSPSPCGRGLGGGVGSPTITEPATISDSPNPSPYPLPQGEGENNGAALLIHADWNSNLSIWERVQRDGFSIEAICANLGISRWKLTQLTKEYCNLTVNEVIDGFKVRGLKSFMLGRIKDAAFELWGKPGHFAQLKAEGFINCQEKCATNQNDRRDAGDTAGRMPALRTGRKQSRYFHMTPQELFNEPKWAEKARRTAALVEKMWEGFDFESWAVSAGYSNAARLKRAVLTVMGKTLGKLEELLATEVIEYYMCAEDRELRNLALREDECAAVFRARELYHRSEDRPAGPFADMWSAFEFAKKEWLTKMAEAFG